MKHKHCDKIVAKVSDMNLVVFYKLPNEEWWQSESESRTLPDEDDIEYFLCLPQHKDVCLPWLNGDKAQQSPASDACWVSSACAIDVTWMPWTSFMKDDLKFRIKPKKEKRWIGVFRDGDLLRNTELSYKTKEQVMGDAHAPRGFAGWQFIEIEVEV